MYFISSNVMKKLHDKYPAGTKVRLVRMDDQNAPPIGTLGIVSHIDSVGTIHVDWENGSRLGVVYLEDCCEVV